VRPGDALDAVLLADPVEHAAGAAIGIADEDVAVASDFALSMAASIAGAMRSG
jgi:hypothetical protein